MKELINIHIHLSHFKNESRILKQTKSLVDNGIMSKIIILALGSKEIVEHEQIDDKRSVIRVWAKISNKFLNNNNKIYKYTLNYIVKIFSKIENIIRFSIIIKNEKPEIINLHQILLLLFIPVFKLVSFNSKYIYDAHELETEKKGLDGVRKMLYKVIERIFIKHFNFIILVSPSIEKWYQNKYKINNTVTVLNCPNYIKADNINLFREEFKISESSKIFIYQGGLCTGRGIQIILETFTLLPIDDYCVVFMGFGELEDMIMSYSFKYKNIFFKHAVPPADVLKYTSSADYGIVLTEDICLNHEYCLPNKLFEYAMAEIPVIVSNLTEMRSIVETYGIGLVTDSYTFESLMKTIKKVDNIDQKDFKYNIKKFNKKYCWEYQEKIMINAYREFI